MNKKIKTAAIVTYGGALPEHQWLTDDRCESVIDAIDEIGATNTDIILAAGGGSLRPYRHIMADYIQKKLELSGYRMVTADSESRDFLHENKSASFVRIWTTHHGYDGTINQTDCFIKIVTTGSFEVIRVVMTAENIPQLKFIWKLAYRGDAKLEFSGKPSRDKRDWKYYLNEKLRMVQAFIHYRL